MHARITKPFQHEANERLATVSRRRSGRVRIIAYWASTFVVVFELVAGSVWNFWQIEWVRVQLDHLGYPAYFTYILGVPLIAGAAAIIAPGLPRLKEWAYAGSFFHFSAAVASHLLAGDLRPVGTWLTPLVFLMFVVLSWALRPGDRRLPSTGLAPERRPLAWTVSFGILVVLFAVSVLVLPWVNTTFHKRAVDLGWIAR
jgi:DoxX-like family